MHVRRLMLSERDSERSKAGARGEIYRMACAKVRKVDTENQAFKEEWTDKYAFILPQ